MKRTSFFSGFAQWVSHITGHPVTFGLGVMVIVVWAITGPMFHYSDTWQLVINTGTTIITFLMVFLIQNTQNRDSKAMQLKLDELIRAVQGAHNKIIDLEENSDEDLAEIKQHYREMAEHARDEDEKKANNKPQTKQANKT